MILPSDQDSFPGLILSRGSWGFLLHPSFIAGAEDQQSGGIKHTTPDSTTPTVKCLNAFIFITEGSLREKYSCTSFKLEGGRGTGNTMVLKIQPLI